MTLSTKFFQGLAAMTAKGRGATLLQNVILPFPLEAKPEAYVIEVARKALPEVVRSLTATGRGMVEVRA